ncbi:MAG: hypothetical protein GXY09_08955 [Bacteroidales bacterium]|jgi:hypothetical protein|nr:hypothetical protein [Bacteroidales bacterium]
MKTTPALFVLSVWSMLAISCIDSTPHDMLTVVNADGTCYREFSLNADSNSLKPDTGEQIGLTKKLISKLPILPDVTWSVTWSTQDDSIGERQPFESNGYDSVLKVSKGEPVRLFVSKTFPSVEALDTAFRFADDNPWNQLSVTHRLQKRFRWFYTYYVYTETYPVLASGFQLPIQDFMKPEEARFWFKGDHTLLTGMNGFEIRDFAGDIESKFNHWLAKNLWYECCDSVYAHYELIPNAPVDKDVFISLKDSLYAKEIDGNPNFDIADALNRFFKTTAYSILDEQKDTLFDSILENKPFIAMMADSYTYRLRMPGRLTATPTHGLVTEEGVTWRLTADRLMLDGLTLEAKSRKANTWAFALTGILILAALVGAFRRKKKA